jgi:hypothetical protein
MSSSLEDAFAQSLASSLNPMSVGMAEYMSVTIKEKKLSTAKLCKEFVKELRSELKQAITDGEDEAVLASLRRQIKEFS